MTDLKFESRTISYSYSDLMVPIIWGRGDKLVVPCSVQQSDKATGPNHLTRIVDKTFQLSFVKTRESCLI